MRNRYDRQLEQLDAQLLEMAMLIQQSIAVAIEALIEQDTELAKQAIEADEEINEKEKEVESLCLKLILQQQPVARDLRTISSVLKMITDMERIGDHAADISEITLLLAKHERIKKLEDIPKMAEATTKMLSDSIHAFVEKDISLAESVINYDDIVDDLFEVVKSDLIDLIQKDVRNGNQAIDLVMVAKYFERIGDHAVNIAEWVIFSLTGEHKRRRII